MVGMLVVGIVVGWVTAACVVALLVGRMIAVREAREAPGSDAGSAMRLDLAGLLWTPSS